MNMRKTLIIAVAGVAALAGCSADDTDPLSAQSSPLNVESERSIDARVGTSFGHDELDITPQQARMQWLRAEAPPQSSASDTTVTMSP